MKALLRLLIATILSTSNLSISLANDFIDSLSIQISESYISIDSFGTSSTKTKSQSYKLYASSKINNNLFVEYGYLNLGKYSANYDISVGALRFVESHSIDFSNSLFASIKLGSTLNGLHSYLIDETHQNKSIYPPNNEFYFSAKFGFLLWQANLDMDGKIYDSGSLYDTYGASSDDYGFSTFYGFALEWGFDKDKVISLNWELYQKIGKGADLKNIDGSTKSYSGRNIDSVGIAFNYMF